MKLVVHNKNVLTGGYCVKSTPLATYHYRQKHVTCRKAWSTAFYPSGPLVSSTMAPRHGTTRWQYLAPDHFCLITTAMQCTERKA